MSGDGWKHMDLESTDCYLCGKRVTHKQSWQYRYDTAQELGYVAHIDCLRVEYGYEPLEKTLNPRAAQP